MLPPFVVFLFSLSVKIELSFQTVDCAVREPTLDKFVNLCGQRRILLCSYAVILRAELVGDVIAVIALVSRENGLINAASTVPAVIAFEIAG